MPRKISASSRRIPVTNLNPAAFAPFGEVIQNPCTHDGEPTLETVEANQGSATKWLDVSHVDNFYNAPFNCRENAKCVMNMFVCRPRQLKDGRLFKVGIMERHPYTPQTFIPMGPSREDKETAYLVIVAPSKPGIGWRYHDADGSSRDEHEIKHEEAQYLLMYAKQEQQRLELLRQQAPGSPPPKASGPPDLQNLQAFIARGDQAVTYGAGTWHAPMVVLGEREVEFVVVQYANGVADDDCQEVEFVVADGGDGVEVDTSSGEQATGTERRTKL